MFRTRNAFLLALGLIYLATFSIADGLRFRPVKDEIHFLESSNAFARPFGLAELRGYLEVVTPLALVTWGALQRLTGDALWSGRFLNLLLSFGLICGVAFASPRPWPEGALAALGLLLFPYTLPLSVHLYTDVMAVACAAVGTVAVLRRKPLLACLAFCAAIATRQYLVQVPAALAAAEALAWLQGDRGRWKTALASVAATSSLGLWVIFFGGLAPKGGLDAWVPRYPAPMLEASAFILSYGLYALSGVGAYFVVVEAVLFRRLPARATWLRVHTLGLAAVLAVLFLIDPPLLTGSHAGGPLGRVSRILLPSPAFDLIRVGAYYLLALVAVVRFSERLDAAFWVVAAGSVLAMKQQIPWEKYLLPTLSSLWILRAFGAAALYGAAERTASTSKRFEKHSSPTPGLLEKAPAWLPKMFPETNVRGASAAFSSNRDGA